MTDENLEPRGEDEEPSGSDELLWSIGEALRFKQTKEAIAALIQEFRKRPSESLQGDAPRALLWAFRDYICDRCNRSFRILQNNQH